MNQGHNSKIGLEIIISGKSYGIMSFALGQTLHSIVAEALGKTNNSGRPPKDWLVKDVEGQVLDKGRQLRDLNFAEGTKLFFSLERGEQGT